MPPRPRDVIQMFGHEVSGEERRFRLLVGILEGSWESLMSTDGAEIGELSGWANDLAARAESDFAAAEDLRYVTSHAGFFGCERLDDPDGDGDIYQIDIIDSAGRRQIFCGPSFAEAAAEAAKTLRKQDGPNEEGSNG